MALSAREMWIILRARDEASRVLRSFSGNLRAMDNDAQRRMQAQIQRGQSMIMVGGAIAAAGIGAAVALNDMTKAAADYTQEAALALTQTDGVVISLEELKQMGRDTARVIPADFHQMQGALYDIFSSIDVTVDESKTLLWEFSRAAVTGQVDLQTAARGTIAILNAYKLPVREVHRVNDVMFQLVRKGVGTYDEFAKSIGRAIPASVRAGQEFEQLAGMMAFLTRNGLSTHMAATSAARALEALVRPRTMQRLENMGVIMKNAQGEFLPLTDILRQMNDQFGVMTAPERSKAMQELFQTSGGTIQARRFFDVVFTNFDEFEERVADMYAAAGAMDEAYEIMFQAPQSQIQLLTNRYEIMRTEIGDKLLPIKMKLVQAVSELLDWWHRLSPGMQNVIVYGAALATGLTILTGAIVMAAGASLILTARFGSIKGAAGKALGGVKGFAKGLGGRAFGAIGLIYLAVEGVKALDRGLSTDVTVGANAAKKALKEFAKDGGDSINTFFNEYGLGLSGVSVHTKNQIEAIQDLDSAIRYYFHRDRWEIINDTLSGVLMDTMWDAVGDKFREIDVALADMVNSGNMEDAEAAFARIAAAAKEQDVAMDELVALFPEYKDAMIEASAHAEAAAEMQERYAHVVNTAGMETEQATEAIASWIEMVTTSMASFFSLEGAYQNVIDKNREMAQAVADSTKDAGDSWEDYIGDFSFTVSDYIKELEKMVSSQEDWATNMYILSGKVSSEVLNHLAKLGPEGAPLVAELTTASDAEIQKIVDLFDRGGAAAPEEFANNLTASGDLMRRAAAELGEDTAKEIARKLAAGEADIESIMREYKLDIERTKPKMQISTSAAEAEVRRFRNFASSIIRTRVVVSGMIGGISGGGGGGGGGGGWQSGGRLPGRPSNRDNMIIAAATGEFIVNARQTRRWLPLLEAINSGRFGGAYQNGGQVGSRSLEMLGYRDESPVDFSSHGRTVFEPGAIVINTEEIDPLAHSMELAYEISRRTG